MCGDSVKEKKQNIFLQIGRFVLLVFITIVFGLFSYYYLMMGLNNKYEEVISYNSSSNVLYKVYLFENDYFDEPYLGMNRTYISSLINYIDIDFNYNLNFSNFVSGEYTYYVRGTIAADKIKEDDGSYWSKSYVLTEPVTLYYDNQNSFNVSTNVKIDYQKYNSLLNEFKKDYGISFNGVFRVELIVNSESKTDNIDKEIPVESLVEVKIPLTQQVIDLSIDLSNNDMENYVSEMVVDNNRAHYVFLSLAILFIFVTLCLIWILFRDIRVFYLSKSQYSKTLKKILSTYDSIYRAKEVYNINSAIVVTQKYHLYRSLYISNSMNIDYYGVSSDKRIYQGQEKREIREILARNKDFVNCLLKSKPKHTELKEEV